MDDPARVFSRIIIDNSNSAIYEKAIEEWTTLRKDKDSDNWLVVNTLNGYTIVASPEIISSCCCERTKELYRFQSDPLGYDSYLSVDEKDTSDEVVYEEPPVVCDNRKVCIRCKGKVIPRDGTGLCVPLVWFYGRRLVVYVLCAKYRWTQNHLDTRSVGHASLDRDVARPAIHLYQIHHQCTSSVRDVTGIAQGGRRGVVASNSQIT
jgi:hypothetical protein